jgi:hypothetical protein
MRQRMLCLFLALVLAVSLAPAALAAGLGNFTPVQSYTGQFSDVPRSAWFYESVGDAYAYGLMNGRSGSQFDPDGTVTIAEVITLSARLHKLYYQGSRDFPASEPWYESYVEYAEENYIINPGEFDGSYNQAATRQEVAWILCKAFPDSALPAINDLHTIPDLNGGGSIDKYYWASGLIRRMYNAGILTGSDNYGSFQGYAQVKRSEVAALAVRMADPSQRRHFTLPELTEQEILCAGYWQDYGVTLGTSGVYRFYPDGSYRADFYSGTAYGGYILDDRAGLFIGNSTIFGVNTGYIRYDPVSGVFGKGIQTVIQGMIMTTDGLTPITQEEYYARLSAYGRA